MMRIEKEKQTVQFMIELYCKKHHARSSSSSYFGALCPECDQGLKYAIYKLDRCRYQEHKGTCRQCSTHCYSPQMRDYIKQVMRFSGPRMLLYSPMVAFNHFFK